MKETHLKINSVLDIEKELNRAKDMHPGDFNSYHEAYGVLKEEVDELWDEIKLKNPDANLIYTEAKQVACMTIRIMQEFDKKD